MCVKLTGPQRPDIWSYIAVVSVKMCLDEISIEIGGLLVKQIALIMWMGLMQSVEEESALLFQSVPRGRRILPTDGLQT